ncbi:MarR family winged helix-turn-helix transcriptional regulator [Cohnella endophytica]|uniref:MarR family winged helix-turn-helix transcriptional regulator n=1 Tax=Cohnella endophytica TaxID=2419778 RepID=UPI001F24CE4E|nr:MarR family transcriptional regulator [Cohnella endophytica]
MSQNEWQQAQRLFASFREVNQAFHQSMISMTQRLGITPVQYYVLKIIVEHPCIGLSELSEKIFSVTSTTSGIVERLVRAGLIYRERPDTNRRAISLTLTPEGEQLWGRISEMNLHQLSSALLELSPEDAEHLHRVHKQIVNIFQRQREEENRL